MSAYFLFHCCNLVEKPTGKRGGEFRFFSYFIFHVW